MDEMSEFMGGKDEIAFSQVCVPLCDRTVLHEISNEVALAEYEPDVRRVLAVRETVMPPAAYVSGGRVECAGNVEYRLLCVTSEGRLCTVNLSTEYEFQAPLEGENREADSSDGSTVFATCQTDHVSARLIAPRKIALKHKLCSHVRVFGTMTVSESLSGEVGGVQRLVAEGEQMIPFSHGSDPIAFRDEWALPSIDSLVISAECSVFVSSVIPKDGAVSASGEILLTLLSDRNGEVEALQRKIPFEGTIEGEGFSEDGSACAEGAVENLTLNVEEGRVSCEGELILVGRSLRRLPLRYTEDLYSVQCETECETKACEIPVAIKCENRNLSQNEKIPLAETRIPENGEILDAWGVARVESCERRGDRYVHTGKCRYWILCRHEGEYSVSDVELPLRYETEADEKDVASGDCLMRVISCRARTDGETLHVDAEIATSADYVGSAPIQWVSIVRGGDVGEQKRPCMTVYYPTPDDTSWSVAKKYRVPQSQLEGDLGSYFLF